MGRKLQNGPQIHLKTLLALRLSKAVALLLPNDIYFNKHTLHILYVNL